jgi:VIT1/CCC1 family predicted Fe2+/Mn2+ transporter
MTEDRWQVLSDKKRDVSRKVRAREFVFGIQDGLISTVGLLSGIWAATQNSRTVLITGVAAAVTGGLSMATGSYLSSKTEKEVFEKEMLDQQRLAAEQPYLAQEALMKNLCEEGLDREAAYRVVQAISQRQDLLLRTVQEKVLGLGTADISQPFKAAIVMFLSFLVGCVCPVSPYLAFEGSTALPVSWGLSIGALLGVGIFKGILTQKPLLRSGMEFALVALGSAVAGWALGTLIEGL